MLDTANPEALDDTNGCDKYCYRTSRKDFRIVIVYMINKMEQGRADKKAENQKTIKAVLWTIMVFILSQIFTAISGWTIVDPVLQKITPPKIKIDPYPFPQLHDGKQWARVNIINDGLSDIESINVEYRLCYMDRFERGKLHSSILRKGEMDYFEVESNLDTNCSIITDPVILKLYKNSEGEYYIQSKKSISSVCGYCTMEIKVFEGNDKISELSYPYPFFEKKLYGENIIGGGYKSFEDAENTSDLIYEGEMEIYIVDPSTACLRGDIDREWCEENGYPTA